MSVKITECPRDAMQGLDKFIPTEKKAEYINELLGVGFDVLDFGSFVSPKAIPQLRDTAEVLAKLDLSESKTKLLAIIANARGAKDAVTFPEIDILGYPFSISETFQKRNTNATIDQSLSRVEEIQSMCLASNKRMLIYISMAFGNPYGDPWSADLAAEWINRLNAEIGISDFALADTVGVSDEANIEEMFKTVLEAFPNLEIGAHLHSSPEMTPAKVMAAYNSGCRSFDSAINGLGGCPMAEDDLVGNVATETLIASLPISEITHIKQDRFIQASKLSLDVFA